MTAPQPAGILVTIREAPAAVKALLFGVLVNKLGWFIQVFLVLFLTHRGFTEVQAGTALGAYGAGTVAGLLVGGALADRLGPRTSILISMLGTAAFVLAVLYVHGYPAMLAIVVVVGTVGQFYRPASAALLTGLTPEHRQVMIFAVYRLALNLGTTAAPLIGAALAAVSWNLLFWGEAVAALLFAAVAAVALPRRVDLAEPGAAEAPESGRAGYLALFTDYRYLLFLLAMLINAAVYVQYLATLPLDMADRGLSTWWFGAVVALNGFIVITCELLMTKLTQTWPARYAAMLGFALLGAGLAAYALPWVPAVFVIGTLIWTLAEIVGGPTMFAYPGIAAPPKLRGRYIGAAHAMFGLGSAVGPVLGVLAFQHIGTALWLWCGLAGLAGVAAAWQGMRGRRTESGPQITAEPAPAGGVS